jgi:homoprotocatechuate degradation regulator HpaR
MTAFAHRNLPRLLLQAREAVMGHFRPNLRVHGLTDQQWRVLRVLGERGATDAGTIAAQAYLLGPSLSGVLTRMERDGLIKRQRDAGDARRTLVQATAKGRRLVQKLAESIEDHYAAMEHALGKSQLAQLYGLLDAVIAAQTTPSGESDGNHTTEPEALA